MKVGSNIWYNKNPNFILRRTNIKCSCYFQWILRLQNSHQSHVCSCTNAILLSCTNPLHVLFKYVHIHDKKLFPHGKQKMFKKFKHVYNVLSERHVLCTWKRLQNTTASQETCWSYRAEQHCWVLSKLRHVIREILSQVWLYVHTHSH